MLELLFALVVLVLDVWAIINVARSSVSTLEKALWVVGILILPVIGFVAWLLLGPRAAMR